MDCVVSSAHITSLRPRNHLLCLPQCCQEAQTKHTGEGAASETETCLPPTWSLQRPPGKGTSERQTCPEGCGARLFISTGYKQGLWTKGYQRVRAALLKAEGDHVVMKWETQQPFSATPGSIPAALPSTEQ